jgi:hypothetical protein
MDVFAGWCGGDMLRTMMFSCLPWSGQMGDASSGRALLL